MLPEISLDTIGFEEIVKKARSQIAEILNGQITTIMIQVSPFWNYLLS